MVMPLSQKANVCGMQKIVFEFEKVKLLLEI